MIAIAAASLMQSTHPSSSESHGAGLVAEHGTDRVTPLRHGASARLAHLSDSELLARTQELVGRSNQVLAALLDHLAEVQARGLHRQRACSSLYTYCIYELRFSEDAAARRSAAAKLVRRFPAILPAVAAGEIHLTGLLMLGPHLTDENHLALLARAKLRTKREISKLIRRVAPLPLVPDRMEPLGPSAPSQPNPTWAAFMESLCPPIRELPPRTPFAGCEDRSRGEGGPPSSEARERLDSPARHDGESTAPARGEPMLSESAAPARLGATLNESTAPARDETTLHQNTAPVWVRTTLNESTAPARDKTTLNGSTAPARRETTLTQGGAPARSETMLTEGGAPPVDGMMSEVPERLGSVDVVDAVVQPKIDAPARNAGEIAAPARREGSGCGSLDATELYLMQFTTTAEHAELVERARALLSHRSLKVGLGELHLRAMRLLLEFLEKRRFGSEAALESTQSIESSAEAAPGGAPPRRRTRCRYIPAKLRRAVYERDGGRCSFVDEFGTRCGELRHIEIHHLHAFALGGEHELQNLALRCRAHNALAAEQDLGHRHMQHHLERDRHESERSTKLNAI